jgi:branched-chain amino acid transport system substrate-binding protein
VTDRLLVFARAAGCVRRGAVVAAAALVALALAGCGDVNAASNDAVTVSGSTLSIYASLPPGKSGGQVATDVFDAERLAFRQSAATIDGYHLRFGTTHAGEISQDARNVVSDKTAIAYLGEIAPGTSGVSVQITNELGLLQVSPTDTATYLTHATPGVKDSPQQFYPAIQSFDTTFGRVVPTTAAEATAIVARMKHVGVSSLDVEHDATAYGTSVADELSSDARAAGLSLTGSPAGAAAMFYAGLPTSAAAHALDAAASSAPHARLFAPSALYDDAFVASLSSAAQGALTVSAPGFLPSSLDAVGRSFVAAFRSAYRHTPVPQAIFGYEAMRAVLAAIRGAGSHAAVRQAVVADFRELTRTAAQSALGAYTLKDGDTNIAPFVFAEVSSGSLAPRVAG